MKDKKTILLILAAVVASLLLAGAGVLLYLGVNKLNDVERTLEDKMGALKVFFHANPFPDQQNIAKEAQNVNQITNRYFDVIAQLKRKQVDPTKVTPTTFMTMLDDARSEVKKMAASTGTLVPPSPGLGFEKRLSLPPAAVVHQLCQQLTMITNLCKVVIEEHATELISVSRAEIFEDVPVAATSAQPGMPPMMPPMAPPAGGPGGVPPGGAKVRALDASVFTKLHFTLQFSAKETTLLKILNRIASHDMIIVVTSMDIDNEGAKFVSLSDAAPKVEPGVEPKPEEVKPAAGALDKKVTLDRSQRVVCAPEKIPPMKVKLELDVYNFRSE